MILKVGASYYINGLYACSSDLIYNHPPWTMEYIHVLNWLLHVWAIYIYLQLHIQTFSPWFEKYLHMLSWLMYLTFNQSGNGVDCVVHDFTELPIVLDIKPPPP